MAQDARWKFWVDRGGTFTDVAALRPDGVMLTAKLLSENPASYDDATVEAIRRLTGAGEGMFPPSDIRIGTTIATNALLERKGEPVLLAITRGFGDALLIGTQDRPEIFARHIVRSPPLYADVIEIDERVTHEGEILRSLDRERAKADLAAAFESFHCMAAAAVKGGQNLVIDHITMVDPPVLQDCVSVLADLPVYFVALKPPPEVSPRRIDERLETLVPTLGREHAVRNSEAKKKVARWLYD